MKGIFISNIILDRLLFFKYQRNDDDRKTSDLSRFERME